MRKIKKQLKNTMNHGNPSEDFSRELFSRISSEITPKKQEHPAWKPVFAGAIAIVLLFTTGTGVYAYESPEVVEGHILHSVKDGIERMEGNFARSDERMARFHAKMLQRRLREAEHFEDRPEKSQMILDRAAMRIDHNGGLGAQLQPDLRELHDRIRAMDISPEERHKLFREGLHKILFENPPGERGMRF